MYGDLSVFGLLALGIRVYRSGYLGYSDFGLSGFRCLGLVLGNARFGLGQNPKHNRIKNVRILFGFPFGSKFGSYFLG